MTSDSSTEPITKFTNCKLCINGREVEDDLWIRGEEIIDKQTAFYVDKQAPSTTIDCNGLYLTPGLIDTQVNGSIGIDFSDLSDPDSYLDRLAKVREHLLQYGVTSFCPSIITSDQHTYELIDDLLQSIPVGGIDGVVGFHYEGPFLSEKFSGAHRKQLLRTATSIQNFTDMYGSMKHVKIITVAPEAISSTYDVIQQLRSKGVTVSIGHTDCTYKEAMEALDQGANSITHLYSCMRPLHHRQPGVIGTISSDLKLYYSLITDGVHVSSPVIRSSYKTNANGLILVTDASSTAGYPPGVYRSNGQNVEVKDDRVVIQGTNTLAGSNATLTHCLKVLAASSNLTVPEAVKCVTENVADMIEENCLGLLQKGRTANLVLMSNDYKPVLVFVKGKVVYKALTEE